MSTNTSTNETIQMDTGSEDASVGANARESGGDAGAEGSAAAQRVVPVAEAKKYRKRAQHAEQSLDEVQRELQAKSQRVTELEQTVADLERRSVVDQLLIEAEAIDLDAARLLTMAAVSEMDEPDVAEAVTELRRTKPFLFRSGAGANGAMNMSPRIDPAHGERSANEAVDHAAAEAHATGDRNDLLRYLRLRRGRRNG